MMKALITSIVTVLLAGLLLYVFLASSKQEDRLPDGRVEEGVTSDVSQDHERGRSVSSERFPQGGGLRPRQPREPLSNGVADVGDSDGTEGAADATVIERTQLNGLLETLSSTADLDRRKALLEDIREYNLLVAPRLVVSRIGLRNDRDLQRVLIERIVESGAPQFVSELVRWAEENAQDQHFSRKVGQVLNEIRNPTAVPALSSGLTSDSFPVSCGAAAALAAIGTPEAVRALTGRFGVSETDDEVLIEALSRVNNLDGLPALLEAAQGATPNTATAKGVSKALLNYPNTAEIRAMRERLSPDA
jgi:HEAT repeat protein